VIDLKKLLLVIFLVTLLVGCTVQELDYSDFANITLSSPSEQLTQEESTYYLYFYSPTCTACLSIKNEVLMKLALLNTDKVYLVETLSSADINSNLYFTKIPTLVKIVDNQIDDYFIGTAAVTEELETLS